jgi:two-component system, chemotaxis family, sensor kinase CheA
MSDSGSRAIQELVSEAQEIVESLSRDLMSIDESLKSGEPDPEMINDVFRGWHTLKGISATFGVDGLSRFAHQEESLLDDIRLGRVEMTPEVLDSLLESVEVVMAVLAAINEAGDVQAADDLPALRRAMKQLEEAGEAAEGSADTPLSELVEQEVLEVLTEFEEHRLSTNLKKGRPLYRIRIRVELQAIDSELEALKKKLKPLGEIITYLPSTEGDDPDLLDIDVLLALQATTDDLEEVLEGAGILSKELVPAGKGKSKKTKPPRAAAERPSGHEAVEPAPSGGPESGSSALAARPEREKSLSLRGVSQTVRVDIGKLDRLMNVVGELNIVRGSVAKVSEELRTLVGRRELAIELYRITRGFERRLAELREGILEVRMVPVSQMFDRLSRLTRKTSRELGKEVNLIVSGGDTEVDKLIIEELSDPLMHIIRNSIDHGVEDPAERHAAGKPDVGTVALTAYQKGNHVLIDIEDDGAGIDAERILEAAIERELLLPEQVETLSPREVLNLIFLPGVSTSSKATSVSGRGVGMDVVKTNIAAIGGVVEVQSELGIGTKFTIMMPVTLAIIPALLVEVNGSIYAVPLNTVAEALLISDKDVRTVMGTETMALREQTLPLCRLDRFLETPRPGPIPEGSCAVVAELGQRRLGLVVDRLRGQQDVVIKPLGSSLEGANVFTGATDIGDQRLALVLDTAAVIEEWFTSGEDFDSGASAAR